MVELFDPASSTKMGYTSQAQHKPSARTKTKLHTYEITDYRLQNYHISKDRAAPSITPFARIFPNWVHYTTEPSEIFMLEIDIISYK
jgi:hypothetical protein